jgi:serine/threonine protein kinase
MAQPSGPPPGVNADPPPPPPESLFEGFTPGDPTELFELLELLGEGTYGKVWKARQVSTGRVVAVKVVYVDDDLEEIQLEIGILQKCKSPYVVGCYGSYDGQEDDDLGEAIWIVMEVCDAGSVNDLMFMCGHTLREGQIRHVVASTLLGLAYLHDRDIIHRDVKSGNLLLTPGGNVKLSDFGVSGVLDRGTRKRNTAIGAPFWMAVSTVVL